MKKITKKNILSFFILSVIIVCCNHKQDRNQRIEYYSLDTSKRQSYEMGDWELVNVFYKDSAGFVVIHKTSNSMRSWEALLSKIVQIKGDFYAVKNPAMAIQYICKENQLLYIENDRITCEICFDHEKQYISVQDSVFEIKKPTNSSNEFVGFFGDSILSRPSYPLPKFKVFFKKSVAILE